MASATFRHHLLRLLLFLPHILADEETSAAAFTHEGIHSSYVINVSIASGDSVPPAGAVGTVGVCFRPGIVDLPSPSAIVQSLKQRGIPRVRLVDPDAASISAFESSGIDLHISLESLHYVVSLAASQANAEHWLKTNLLHSSYNLAVSAIVVGSGILLRHPELKPLLLPAVRNMYSATRAMGLSEIAVSSAFSFDLVVDPIPPSSAQFNFSHADVLVQLLQHNQRTGAPFMVSLFPFHLLRVSEAAADTAGAGDDDGDVTLPFAMFGAREDQWLVDPVTNQVYRNLFELMLDSVFVSLVKLGHPHLPVVVVGTGWPNKDPREGASTEASFLNAAEYNERLVAVSRLRYGTPLQPHRQPVTYIYSLFDDDDDVAGDEWNGWGIWRKDLQPNYKISFVPDEDDDGGPPDSSSSAFRRSATTPLLRSAAFAAVLLTLA